MANDYFAQPGMEPELELDEHGSEKSMTCGKALPGIGPGNFTRLLVVSNGGFDAPQIRIVQTYSSDFARLRFSLTGTKFWDIATTADRVNFFKEGVGDVMSLRHTGELQNKGKLTQGSSRSLKEDVAELTGSEAVQTVAALSPVKFRYKADRERTNHLGFIAEDVPDLVATPDRKSLSAMDIVAVLTKAMQEQQKTIDALLEKVAALKTRTA